MICELFELAHAAVACLMPRIYRQDILRCDVLFADDELAVEI